MAADSTRTAVPTQNPFARGTPFGVRARGGVRTRHAKCRLAGDIFPGALWQSIPRSAGIRPPNNHTHTPPARRRIKMDKATRPLDSASPVPAPPAPAAIDDGFIKSRILTIRGVQVMLDRDLAILYGVEVKQLNRQVKRNIERFPQDFMFQLSREECLRCQIGTINGSRGQHLKYMPYAFSENGVAMLSGVLRSSMAIEVNIKIMRVFTAMRKCTSTKKKYASIHMDIRVFMWTAPVLLKKEIIRLK